MTLLRITPKLRIGFHPHGNCWRFRFSRVRYSHVTFYNFWRFYVAKDHQRIPYTAEPAEPKGEGK